VENPSNTNITLITTKGKIVMKKTQWLAMGILLCTAGAASATPAYGIISAANIEIMTTTSLSSTPTLVLKSSGQETCLPGPDGGLDLGDVNSALTKANLSMLLTARTTNSDIAVGYDDATCVVHTLLLAPPSA